MNHLLERYNRVLAWWQALGSETRLAETRDFAMEFAYHSARIEGAELTYEEAREVYEEGSVTAYTGDVRSLVSITNQRVAFAWMLEQLASGHAFDEQLLLTLHKALTYGTYGAKLLADGERPGTYKRSDYIVRGTFEVGASPDDCPVLTRELMAEVASELDTMSLKRALTIAAYLHNALVTIHPFAEGTGRTARDLMNLILLAAGHAPVIIFDDETNTYYQALEAFDDTGDLDAFKQLLMSSCVRTWEDRVR